MNNKKKEIVKYIIYGGILAILCIVAYLIAKYLMWNDINWEKPPVDVSEKI